MIVDTDDVLALFGISDRDIYARGTIEDAIYDGILKPAELEIKTGRWEFIGDNLFQCSCCGAIYTTQQLDNLRQKSGDEMYFADFCPNCGERKGR